MKPTYLSTNSTTVVTTTNNFVRRRNYLRKILFLLFLFCFCGTIQAQVNLDKGLVAYYPFNGNANDESENGNNGTVNGATLTSDRFGIPNSAYRFDWMYKCIQFNKMFF